MRHRPKLHAGKPRTILPVLMAQAEERKRPFKKFFCDDDDVFRLPDPAFKIWMLHYRLEGRDRKSWPSLATIGRVTGQSVDTVKTWRGFLVKHGWLEPVGKRETDGRFGVPELRVRKGTIPPRGADGRRRNRPPTVKPEWKTSTAVPERKIPTTDRVENFHAEVDRREVDISAVPAGDGPEQESLRKVFDYFLQELNHDPTFYTFTPHLKKMGLLRFRECLARTGGDSGKAGELMCCAIDAIRDDPWHNGKDPRNKKTFLNWEHVFGTQEKFEGWLRKSEEN